MMIEQETNLIIKITYQVNKKDISNANEIFINIILKYKFQHLQCVTFAIIGDLSRNLYINNCLVNYLST